MTTYQKFQNPPSYNTENGPMVVDPPSYPFPTAPPQQPSILNGQVPYVQQPKKELKSLASLRLLVRVELALAMAMIFLEAIMDGVVNASYTHQPGTGPCTLGTGIWVGVLGLITAGLGWGAFRQIYGNRCMIVAHFVMSIICAVADGIMIVFAGICMSTLPWLMRGTYYYNAVSGRGEFREASAAQLAMGRGLMATESFLLLAAIAHLVSSIVSTAFICRNWCQDSQPAVAVVYFPGTNQQASNGGAGSETSSDPCRVAVPSGAHVIFVPMGNGSGQAVFPPSVPPQQQPPQPDFRNVQT